MFSLYDELPIKDIKWTSGLTPEAAGRLVTLIESFNGERNAAIARAEAAEAMFSNCKRLESQAQVRIADLEAERNALRAERNQLHRDWSTARDEIDALRAQVEAQGWHGFNVKPAHGQRVEIRTIETAVYDALDDTWKMSEGATWEGWRPAPPKE